MNAPSTQPVDRFTRALSGIDRLALAVSGGPDSLALLLLAAEALPNHIAVATVDHGLRPEAAHEAAYVSAICEARGIPHDTLRVSVETNGEGTQAAARTTRYDALARWCADRGFAHLATAHHADDQAETLLMRLGRGAGLPGLTGIRSSRPLTDSVTLIRPLLGHSRAELRAIVDTAGIAPVDDPSNRDPHYDRTRARALLSNGYPDAHRLAQSASHLAQAEEALAWAAAQEWSRRAAQDGSGVSLDPAGLPDELRRRLVLFAFETLGASAPRGPDLARLIATLAADKIATLGGIRAEGGPLWRFRLAPPHRSGRSS
ncbi:tRNA lysidine(34) synthetase TilS [Sphingomonas sp. ID0503]|uniref:tRNA lysidine(34) synthetase TilS n=1 Tax=Sphingomonas sp. ID0503 TaxID=3399691 RepID=UPI003AFAE3B3